MITNEQCHGKNIYASEREARVVRKGIYKKRTTRLRIYFHKDCRGYHLTKEF